jgi:hypothetical protein
MTKELKGELISYEVDVDDDEGTNFDENESSVGGINFDQDIKDYIDEELDDQKNDYGKYFCGDTDFSETTKILMDEIDELKKGAKKSAEKPSTE